MNTRNTNTRQVTGHSPEVELLEHQGLMEDAMLLAGRHVQSELERVGTVWGWGPGRGEAGSGSSTAAAVGRGDGEGEGGDGISGIKGSAVAIGACAGLLPVQARGQHMNQIGAVSWDALDKG